MDHVLGRMSEKSVCGVSFGTVKIADLDFADDAVIFAGTTEVFAGALDSLSEESEPLGLRVPWTKTKVQALGVFAAPGFPSRKGRAGVCMTSKQDCQCTSH